MFNIVGAFLGQAACVGLTPAFLRIHPYMICVTRRKLVCLLASSWCLGEAASLLVGYCGGRFAFDSEFEMVLLLLLS